MPDHRVPAPLTEKQRWGIDTAIRHVESRTRCEVSVFVGSLEQPARTGALRLHEALTCPDLSVLVAVDPVGRAVEVVVGDRAHERISCATADQVARRTAEVLRDGDLARAVVTGLSRLDRAGAGDRCCTEPELVRTS